MSNEHNKDRYQHRIVEEKWRTRWLADKRYTTDTSAASETAYILDMFPYPSGDGLHVGHPLGYIGTDILARYFRALGKEVLHPMGYDAFGLPAENYAIKTGTPPAESTAKAIARFREQMQLIGLSYDWDREVVTSDPDYYKWTQWIFLRLFEKGLAYRAEAPVNWCPKDQTVLANEQVKDGRCERCDTPVEQKNLKQWFFKITAYADELLSGIDELDWPASIKAMQRNWIGKSEGAVLKFPISHSQFLIEVFTTRPDTLFGATYLVLAPEHPLLVELKNQISNRDEVDQYIAEARGKKELERKAIDKPKTGVELKGITAVNPANQEEIQVWIADYVLMGYGTGAIMAVPAHDERDFAFAKQNNLPIRTVIEPSFTADSGDAALRRDQEIVKRDAVCAIVRNPVDDTYLCIEWKNVLMHGLVTGGIDEGEDVVEAARREVYEETGYKNLRQVETPEIIINTFFYHRVKKQNRWARFHYVFFDLVNDERAPIQEDEAALHQVVWKKKSELKEFFTVFEGDFLVNLLSQPIDDFIFTQPGILVNSGEFSGQDSQSAKGDIVNSVRGSLQTQYRLRDWLVSRQRYWGAPIPIIVCDTCGDSPVPDDQLPVTLPDDVDFRPSGESPLVRSQTFHAGVICPKCHSPAKREVDTMDTFVDSSWYFLRYVSPHLSTALFDTTAVNRWLPVDYYVGGAEHAVLHLLYARFFTKALADEGLVAFREPFTRLRNQGLIMGEDQRKMSKRWGNVINPDDVVRDYGADALRCFEMFMGPFTDSKPWSSTGLIGVRRWIDRVWKLASRSRPDHETPQQGLEALHATIGTVTSMIQNFEFNTAISELMKLTNSWEKLPSINQKDWKIFVQLLAPFAPHIAHELWEQAGFGGKLDREAWPTANKQYLEKSQLTIPVQVNGKLRGTLKVKPGLSEAELIGQAQQLASVAKYLDNHEILKTIVIGGRVVSFVIR